MPAELKDKIALFCNIKPHAVVENLSTDILYEVPLLLEKQGMDQMVVDKLGLQCRPTDMSAWHELVERSRRLKKEVTIALVGKYISLRDAYLSINESLYHAGYYHDAAVQVKSIQAEDLESGDPADLLGGVDGILVPGGFGDRGIEGKINAIRYARENKIPFLGVCLGMQCAVIEFARHVAGITGAHSTEFKVDTPWPVIDALPGQQGSNPLSGSLRLGTRPCTIKDGTLAEAAYGERRISERHRHRYGFNNRFRELLEEKGMVFSGINEEANLVEIIELKGHPWFVGVQFHPEFKSRPQRPHPLFRDFIGSALKAKA